MIMFRNISNLRLFWSSWNRIYFSQFPVPDHFLPVIEAALREFMNSIKCGKDAEPSWKKQIYKIIARYDEPIPEYFKTQEFLQQLE